MRKSASDLNRTLAILTSEHAKRAARLANCLETEVDPADLADVAAHREKATELRQAVSDAEAGIAKVGADLEAAVQREPPRSRPKTKSSLP